MLFWQIGKTDIFISCDLFFSFDQIYCVLPPCFHINKYFLKTFFETIRIWFYNDLGPEDKIFLLKTLNKKSNKNHAGLFLTNFVQAKTKKLNAQLACFKMGEDTLITLKT